MSEDIKPVKRRATAKKVTKKFNEEMTDEKWAERRNIFSSLFGQKPAEATAAVTVKEIAVDDDDIISQLVEKANRENNSKGGKKRKTKKNKKSLKRRKRKSKRRI